MIALAAIFSYIEGLFPISLGAPGIKLGLANIVVLFALYAYGAKAGAAVSLLRIALVAALFGNMMAAVYSLAGAAVSLAVMLLLKNTGRFSLAGVSMAGGVSHPAAQMAVAMLITRTPSLLAYLPVLILGGMLAGLLMGLLAYQVLQRVAPAWTGRRGVYEQENEDLR